MFFLNIKYTEWSTKISDNHQKKAIAPLIEKSKETGENSPDVYNSTLNNDPLYSSCAVIDYISLRLFEWVL